MAEFTDRIVEFLSSGSLKMGLVTSQGASKLQLTDVNGRNLSLAPKHVVILHPDRCERPNLVHDAQQLEESIEALRGQVDTELLWESVRTQGNTFTIEALALEYFGEANSRQQSAIFRSVLEDRLHFKLKGLEVLTRTPEQVAEQQHAMQIQAERAALAERRDRWLEAILEGPAEIPEEFQALVTEIEDLLIRQKGGEIERLLERLDSEKTAKEAAFEILVHCGLLPEDADPLLIIAGIEERFPAEVLSVVDGLAAYSAEPSRQDFSRLAPISIDDPDTLEVDDAITVEPLSGGWRVGIHIADASHFVPDRGVVFEEAMRRGATLYLPNRTVTMFPEALAYEMASLHQDGLRPSVSIVVDFDVEAQVLDWNLVLGQLSVSRRLDYDGVDRALSGPTAEAWIEPVRVLDSLTQRLQQERVASGALIILKPELKIRVDDAGEVTVKVLEKESPSRRIVSELMILANRLAAEYAIREGVPVIYRTQDPPSEPVDLPGHYDPVMTDQAFKKLKRSGISLEPAPHSSLGLDAYAQITSPIRRLSDLVSQQQIAAHLRQQPLPHSEEDLEAIQAAVRSSEKDLRTVERKANRFFLLKYLDEHLQSRPLEAVVLGSTPSGYPVETCELYARGRLISPADHAPGEHLTVRIDRIDPEGNRLTFRLYPPD